MSRPNKLDAGAVIGSWVCRKPNKLSVLVACENGSFIRPRVNLRDGHDGKPKRLKKKRIKYILAACDAAIHVFQHRCHDIVICRRGCTWLPWERNAS